MQLTVPPSEIPDHIRKVMYEDTINIRQFIDEVTKQRVLYVVEWSKVQQPVLDIRLDLAMAAMAEAYAMDRFKGQLYSLDSVYEIEPGLIRLKITTIPLVTEFYHNTANLVRGY